MSAQVVPSVESTLQTLSLLRCETPVISDHLRQRSTVCGSDRIAIVCADCGPLCERCSFVDCISPDGRHRPVMPGALLLAGVGLDVVTVAARHTEVIAEDGKLDMAATANIARAACPALMEKLRDAGISECVAAEVIGSALYAGLLAERLAKERGCAPGSVPASLLLMASPKCRAVDHAWLAAAVSVA